MRVVITGAGGFLGARLLRRLAADGTLDGRPVGEVVLFDAHPPQTVPADAPFPILSAAGDIADPAAVAALFAGGADAVFHLAAVVSGQAEADFDLGMRVNLDGTRAVLEACRALPAPPRLVFASSLAVFGGGNAGVVGDDTPARPENSYGAQKAAGEILVGEYARRGFVDGRALRLPTVIVRPGAPNAAASGFASSIVREPLQGFPAVCPVEVRTEMWVLSPRRAVDALVRAHDLPASAWGTNRVLNLPGLTVSVAQVIDAVRAVGGDRAANLIRWQPDERVRRIVYGWPARFAPERGLALGFRADADAHEIVRAFAEDELGRTRFQ